ncbi:helix-turn-helix domain-containing protein [[Collinsella] massiliensis]|nr:helix-turn-helix domain-containing protein [[Collinsella] massiliensis]
MRETMGRTVPEDEGRLQANDAEIPGMERDSAEALGGAGEPAGAADETAGEPHGRVSMGVLRTLFILNILEERTDAHQGITADDIKALLAAPTDPATPALTVSRSAVRSSIDTLRTAGYKIITRGRCGYALVEHPLGDRDAELAVRALASSRLLSPAQRRRLIERILRFASPTQRAALAPHAPDDPKPAGSPVQTREGTAKRFFVDSPAALVRHALAEDVPLAFELAREAPVPDRGAHHRSPTPAAGPPRGYGKRQRMQPTSLFESHGEVFVQGTALDMEIGSVAVARTLRLDRLANLSCIDGQGDLHIAPGRAAADAAAAPYVKS